MHFLSEIWVNDEFDIAEWRVLAEYIVCRLKAPGHWGDKNNFEFVMNNIFPCGNALLDAFRWELCIDQLRVTLQVNPLTHCGNIRLTQVQKLLNSLILDGGCMSDQNDFIIILSLFRLIEYVLNACIVRFSDYRRLDIGMERGTSPLHLSFAH